jgi:uncharacterized membrane protein YbhN (UPF0104 family)
MTARNENHRSSPIWTALKIVLALVLAAFVVSRTDLPALLALREQIIPAWLAFGFVLFILLTFLKALQYYFLLGRRVSYPEVLHVVIVQNAISNFIATSAGIASYLTLFRMEHDVKLSRSAVAFLLAKVGDLSSIWLLLIISSLSLWAQIGPLHLAVEILIIGMGLALLGFFLLVGFRQRFVSLLRKIAAWLKLDHIRLVPVGLDALAGMAEQKQSFVFRSITVAVLFSLLYMGITMAWVYAGLRTFSLPVGVMPTVFSNTFIQLISYLPIQVFGGLGLTETSMFYFFSFFHLPQVELAAVLIGTRLLFYLENLVVLIYLPLHSLFSSRMPEIGER